MDFTPRTQQILEILLGGKGPVSKQEIADHLGVSKRTIQREFGFLESDIKKYGLGLVNRRARALSSPVSCRISRNSAARSNRTAVRRRLPGMKDAGTFFLNCFGTANPGNCSITVRCLVSVRPLSPVTWKPLANGSPEIIWRSSAGPDTAWFLEEQRAITVRRCGVS